MSTTNGLPNGGGQSDKKEEMTHKGRPIAAIGRPSLYIIMAIDNATNKQFISFNIGVYLFK